MTNEEESGLWRGFDARLQRLEDVVSELDQILRGDRHRKIIGLISEQDRMDLELRRLNAVIFTDSTGKHGLAHDVESLMDRRSGSERRSEYRWQFWTAILVALISATTAILSNLDKLKSLMPRYHPAPLEAKIDLARHPKSPKKLYRYRAVKAAPSDDMTEDRPKSP